MLLSTDYKYSRSPDACQALFSFFFMRPADPPPDRIRPDTPPRTRAATRLTQHISPNRLRLCVSGNPKSAIENPLPCGHGPPDLVAGFSRPRVVAQHRTAGRAVISNVPFYRLSLLA